MSSFQDLPRELQTRVVGLLSSSCLLEDTSSPEDAEDFLEKARGQNFGHLARAALVCRQWRCMAEDPLLWRDFMLCLDSSSDLSLLPGMDRFSLVRSIVVRAVSVEQLTRLGQQVADRTQGGKLETLVFLGQNFKGLSSLPGLFPAVPRLKNFLIDRVDLLDQSVEYDWEEDEEWNTLTSAQKEALFAELAGALDRGRCKLQSLSLGGTTLCSIPPAHLAKVVAGLRKADIDAASLGSKQVTALMTALLERSSLQELIIEESDLSQVEPNILARVVHRIKKVSLDITQTSQLEAVFEMCTGVTELKTLFICGTEGALERIDRSLIDWARKRVEILLEEDMEDSGDEDQEVEDLFEDYMDENPWNISEVEDVV